MAAVSRALAGIKHPPRSSPRRMSRGRRAVAVAAAKAPATSIASNANDEASSAQEGGYFGSGFDAPNEYGYFESAITVAEQKRKDKLTEGGFKQIKGLSAEEEKARYARLCSKHPESQRCAEGFSQKYVTKPATTSKINGSLVRSDGIILVPGNREDLITYVLDPKMSGDTIGLLIPRLCHPGRAAQEGGGGARVCVGRGGHHHQGGGDGAHRAVLAPGVHRRARAVKRGRGEGERV